MSFREHIKHDSLALSLVVTFWVCVTVSCLVTLLVIPDLRFLGSGVAVNARVVESTPILTRSSDESVGSAAEARIEYRDDGGMIHEGTAVVAIGAEKVEIVYDRANPNDFRVAMGLQLKPAFLKLLWPATIAVALGLVLRVRYLKTQMP